MEFTPSPYTISFLRLSTGETFSAEIQGYLLIDDDGKETGLGYHMTTEHHTLDVVHLVTHIPSGYEFSLHFLHEHEVQRFCREIASLFDWTQDVRALYSVLPSLKERLREALYASIGGVAHYDHHIVRIPKETRRQVTALSQELALGKEKENASC